MCQLLVRLKDNDRLGHPNTNLAYRNNDIVTVVPDSHVFGSKEGPPDFSVISLPGESVEDYQIYVEPETETVAMPDGDEEIPIRRRLYEINFESMTTMEKTQYTDGNVSFPKISFSKICFNKVTRQSEFDRERGEPLP